MEKSKFILALLLTGFICILLSSFFTYFVVNFANERDSQQAFLNDTTEVLDDLVIQLKNKSVKDQQRIIGNLNKHSPFDINVKSKAQIDPHQEQLSEISRNQYKISYYNAELNKTLTFKDKSIEIDLEEDEADDESDMFLDFIERISWLLAIILLLGGGFYILSKQTYKHIQKLMHASEQISLGQFSVDIPTDSPEPIRQMAYQLNKTRDNIKHLLQKEKTLAFAIPHELRTPLSKIRLALDLSRKNNSLEDYQLLIEDLDNYTDELETLITQLMALTQSETKLIYTEIQITEKLNEIKEDYLRLFPDKNITLQSDVKTIVSSEAKLNLILNNLMQNAVNYSDQKIHITVTEDQRIIELNISNDGEIIPKEENSKIFDPFYRIEKSRNRKTGGAGIGLALVKQAVEQLGGSIQFNQAGKLATNFKVTLEKQINNHTVD